MGGGCNFSLVYKALYEGCYAAVLLCATALLCCCAAMLWCCYALCLVAWSLAWSLGLDHVCVNRGLRF